MPRGLGIDISDQRVRIAVVEHSAKRVRLVSYHEQPIAAADEKTPADEAAAAALRAAVAQVKARGRMAASLDSGDAILRELSLPFKTDDQIKKTYRFELESLIHNYSIDDLICDYFKVSETDKGATILAAAVPRTVIDQRLQAFQKAQLDPAQLDLDVAAAFNAIACAGAVETDEPFLVVYGTARFTKIVLVEKRRPRSIRTIRFSFPVSETAEGAPAQFGELDPKHRTQLIEILSTEISRFLLANAESASPSHILLTGEYETAEAAGMLQAGTGLPVKPLAILDRIEHPFAKEEAERAGRRAPVAIGLALKACDADELGLDFRRQEFSYAKKYDALRTTAFVTVELAIVLLAAFALYFHFRAQDLRALTADMQKRQARLYKEALNEEPRSPEEAYVQFEDRRKELESKTGGGDHPIERSALDLANQFYRAVYQLQQESSKPTGRLEGKDLYFLIEDVKVSQVTTAGNESVTLQVSGTIQSVAYAVALQNQVKAVEPFSDKAWTVEIPGFEPTKDGMQRFSLKAVKAKKK